MALLLEILWMSLPWDMSLCGLGTQGFMNKNSSDTRSAILFQENGSNVFI
jgi:hypothetical protein